MNRENILVYGQEITKDELQKSIMVHDTFFTTISFGNQDFSQNTSQAQPISAIFYPKAISCHFDLLVSTNSIKLTESQVYQFNFKTQKQDLYEIQSKLVNLLEKIEQFKFEELLKPKNKPYFKELITLINFESQAK